MKVKARIVNEKEIFKPFEITIELESQKEFDQFHFLFNYSPITDTVINLNNDKIRAELSKFGTEHNPITHTILEKTLERKMGF